MRRNCGGDVLGQHQLSKGAPVFVRTGTDVHSLGTLLETPSEGGDCLVQVQLRDEDSPRRVAIDDVLPANASDASDAEDVCSLSLLHEPAVTHNLRLRYERSEIYTRAGPVLVAVNPFRHIEGLYSSETAARYAEQEAAYLRAAAPSAPSSPPLLPPHIFETASRAYSAMVASGKSQSIIISGESGAGKTESAKLALRQVAALAAAAATATSSSSSSSNVASAAGDEFAALEAAILATNPILESFGNAKTSRNDNSSRFGKLIELLYSEKKGSRSSGSGTFAAAAAAPPPSSFVVSGARLSTCLLERSRLVARPAGERNFHILYQLVAGADGALREELRLPPKEEREQDGGPSPTPPPPFLFRYLSGGPSRIDGVDDAAEFRRVAEALSAVGVGAEGGQQDEQRRIWRALAAVLHLGDVEFAPAEQGEASEVSRGEGGTSSLAALENAAALLGVRAEELERVLTTKEITAGGGGGGGSGGGGGASGGRRKSRGGGDRVVRRLRPVEARSSRDALAKAVYSVLFDWLVARINRRLAPKEAEKEGKDNEKKTSSSSPSISLLDIYGFECFEENGFEQLCINYANEHLQAQFNSVLLALEQEAYEGEGVDFSRVEWRSNEETLDAMDARPGGNAAQSSSSPRFSVGLLALLDEACLVPGGTDAGFGLRVSEVLAGGGGGGGSSSSSSSAASTPSSAKASAAAFASSSSSVVSGCPAGAGASFSVAHAAGKVSYSTSGFLSKNRDVVSAEALALLSKFSTEPLLKEIAEAATTGNSNGSSSNTNNNATVVSAFRLQLRSLLSRLGASQLHFVRCIKPNAQARADCFDGALVAHQLRCAGVAEVARVARQGFPTRAPFPEIANRFAALVFPPQDDVDDHRATVSALLSSPSLRARLADDDDAYALGRTKVFMRAGVLAALEAELRVRSAAATAVSARFRGHRQRARFLEARRSAVAIQAAVRGRAARKLVEEERERRAREERRRAEEAAKEAERAKAAATANAAAAASLTVLRGAEKLVEAADAEAAAAAKRAASGGVEAKRSGSGKWLLPKVPLSLRRGSRSNDGGVNAAAAPATPRPPPASSSGAATEVALWEAYAERLEAQVASLLRTNRALQGSLAAARADARALAATAAATAGAGNSKKSKSCFSSCSSSVVASSSSPSSSSPTRCAAAEHTASLRALDALRESLEKREALFEDDAAFLAEVATGAVAATPQFQLLEETRRLRKRFSSFVGSFSGRMEATEVVVLGAAEAKRAREQAGGGGGGASKNDFLIAAAAASPLQEGGGKIATSERRGTAVVSLEARAA